MTSTTEITDLTEDHDEHDRRGDHDHDAGEPGTRTYEVTVRTPAGFSRVFRVRSNLLVERLTTRAVAYFTDHDQLTGENWRLELVQDGHSQPLVASARLDEAGVHADAILALVSTDPQVDG